MECCWVAQGATCPDDSRVLGHAPRPVENWVRRTEAQGLAGLTEGPRSGRPRRFELRPTNCWKWIEFCVRLLADPGLLTWYAVGWGGKR